IGGSSAKSTYGIDINTTKLHVKLSQILAGGYSSNLILQNFSFSLIIRIMTNKRILKLLALFCLLVTTNLGAKDIEFNLNNFLDDGTYYGAYVGKQKLGYGFTQVSIIEKNSIEHLSYTGSIFLEFSSDDDFTTQELKFEYLFSLENKNHLVAYTENFDERIYRNVQDLNNNNYKERQLSGLSARYLGNDAYEIVINGDPDQNKQVVKLPALYASDYLAAEYLAQRGSERGELVEVLVGDINFEDKKAISFQHKVVNIGRYGSSNQEFIYYEIQSIDSDDPLQKVRGQYDVSGAVISASGSGLDLKREPESVAKDRALDRNLYSLGTINVTSPLIYNGDISEIVLEVHSIGISESFVENDRQTLLESNTDYSLIKLTKGQNKIPTTSDISVEEFLKYDPKYNWQSPLITSLNQSLDMSDLDDEQKVKYLIDFTYNYIEYDFTLSASIDEIVSNKTGDCTEYAQLFITLARLNGIPSKEVSGLVYNYDEDAPGFSQHAWVEVWLNGGWTEVDPGWNEFNVDATHIQLDENRYSFSFNDEIQVVSYK
ncbi:hypothetical protein N9X02_12050, partial [Planktomarina temperata]|nr:hypothetical protein [Planktomarina temperata]